MERKFFIKDAIVYGFRTTWQHIWFVVPLNLAVAGMSLLITIFIFGTASIAYFGYPIIGYTLLAFGCLAAGMIGLTMAYGYIKALMEIEYTGKSTIAYIYQFPQYTLPFFVAVFAYSIVGMLGFAFFIVPGLLWIGSRGFFDFIMIEKKHRTI